MIIGSKIPSIREIPDLFAWLDASDTSTIINTLGAVREWLDKSGTSKHTTQVDGAKMPTTGAATKNGLNVLSFDGGNALNMSSGWFDLGLGNASIFAVAQSDITANANIMRMSIAGSTRISLGNSSSSIAGQSSFGWHAGTTSVSGVTQSNYNIYTAVREGTNRAIAVGNLSPATGTGALSFTPDAGAIGAGSGTPILPWNGKIAEIIVFSRALSVIERSIVYQYLKTKWDL